MTPSPKACACLALVALLVACGSSADPSRGCVSHVDCDDGLFCDGAERCVDGICTESAAPCAEGCAEGAGCVGCSPPDGDRDGHPALGCGGDDCDDSRASVRPRGVEACNDRDDDCDGAVDEGLAFERFLDRDGDGHGAPGESRTTCYDAAYDAPVGDDCDDARPDVHPGSKERCDGRDEDCSGVVDDGAEATCELLEGVAEPACVSGACRIAACAPGRGDCDGRLDTGCETDVASDVDHCGACGRRCAFASGTAACSEGACVLDRCAAGAHVCDGRCVPDTSTASCGDRCEPCPAPISDGTAFCEWGYSCRMGCADRFQLEEVSPGVWDCLWSETFLDDLSIDVAPLEPAFDPTRGWYVVRAPLSAGTATVVATAPPGATVGIAIDGTVVASGAPSAPIDLPLGTTTISIRVTAESGSVRTYGLSVTRGATRIDFLKGSRSLGSDAVGSVVALDGDTLVVGAPGDRARDASGVPVSFTDYEVGAVYVFRWNGTVWMEEAYLKAFNADARDQFGASVAVSGDLILVGAPGEDSAERGAGGLGTDDSAESAGAAYVYRRSGSTWALEAYLKASNTASRAGFGASVAISSDAAVVGSPSEASAATGVDGDSADTTAARAGAAYVFRRTGGLWAQESYLKASNTDAWDQFGHAVAIDGATIAVGAIGESSDSVGVNGDEASDAASRAGAVYVFERRGALWSQAAYVKASDAATDALFGASVALDGGTLVVGSPAATRAGLTWDRPGAAYVFSLEAAGWRESARLRASVPDHEDEFGRSVDVDGDWIVVGAPREDGGGRGVPTDPSTNALRESGATYLYALSGAGWVERGYLRSIHAAVSDDGGRSVAVSGDWIAAGVPGDDRSILGGGGSGSGAAVMFAPPR